MKTCFFSNFPFQSLSRCVPGIGMYFCTLHGLTQNFGRCVCIVCVIWTLDDEVLRESLAYPSQTPLSWIRTHPLTYQCEFFFFCSKEPSLGESVLMGACARTLVGVTMLPVTVLKARYEVMRIFIACNGLLHISKPYRNCMYTLVRAN